MKALTSENILSTDFYTKKKMQKETSLSAKSAFPFRKGLAFSTILFLAIGFFAPRANALGPNDVSIENKTGPHFMLHKNSPCNFDPGAAYVTYQVCNTSGATLTGVTAELGSFSSGFGLAGGQNAAQTISELEAGACQSFFWYMSYPCTFNTTTDMTVTVSDSAPGTKSRTDQVTTHDTKPTGSGAAVTFEIFGDYVTEHGEVCYDVEYYFKNVKKDKVAYFQPAVNLDFAAGCLQLSRFEILYSDLSGVPTGSGSAFHYEMPNNNNGNRWVYVRYYFKLNCADAVTNLKPFATGTGGNTQLKHHNGNSPVTSINIAEEIDLPCSFSQGPDFQLIDIADGTSGDNWGGSWGDYNNDGYPDLFVVTDDETQPNELYRNNGDGTFTKVTTGLVVTDLAPSLSSSWADFDNDGDLDLYVANNIGFQNFLYRNEGNGNFVSIQGDPIVSYLGYSHGASWADFDNDGFLDLFVATLWQTAFNKLYKNNGDGTFREVTNNPVVNEAARSLSGVWADYDGDGFQDLFVVNIEGQNSLYRNTGGGNFEKINSGDIVNDTGWSTGASWGDYDNDGDLDLFVANASDEANFLYQNNGDGTFAKVTSGVVATDLGHTHGSAWGDYDNDGDLDLFTANDGTDNVLYENDGTGNFTKVNNIISNGGGLSFGSAWADFDRDGDLDLFVANREGGKNFLYQNEKWGCNNWACIKLEGTSSNASAVGARVTVTAEIDGQNVTQTQEITSLSGGGTGGQSDFALHFGLGDADIIQTIEVRWPSGYRQTLTAQAVNDCTSIEEDNASEVSGYVYYADKVKCEEPTAELPDGAASAAFRTIADGAWNQSSTWADGNVPSNQYLYNKKVSIEHDVTLNNGNIYMVGNSDLWISNGKLKMVNGNMTIAGGTVHVTNAELEMANGNLDLTNWQASLNVLNSHIDVNGHLTSTGSKTIEKSCVELSGSYTNSGDDILSNVNLTVGGHFQNYLWGTVEVDDVKLRVKTGGCQNLWLSELKGEGFTVWCEVGSIQNSGSWSADIDKYCVGYAATGLGSFLPAAEECDMAALFSESACSEMFSQNSGNSGGGEQDEKIGIRNARVVLNPGGYTVYTDENGYYSAMVPADDYVVQVFPGDNYEVKCPENGTQLVSVNGIGNEYDGVDFGHETICDLPDMKVEVALTAHRVGFENLMVINYENIGVTVGSNISLLVTLDESIEPVEASIPWDGLAPTILVWSFAELQPGEQGTIYLTYTIDENTPIGENIEVKASLTCAEGDCNVVNDEFSLMRTTVGAIDPNDILVSPEGGIPLDQALTYTIRFQNVGNTPAALVRIEDELPTELDLRTLEIGSASHAYEFQAQGNKLVWTFPNINLPDSLNNEPESHGFVTFRIRSHNDLRVGDKILNRAAITFDNQESIITNTVENFILAKVDGSMGNVGDLFIFPNPTTGAARVHFLQPAALGDNVVLQTLEVFDPFGRLVLRQHQAEGEQMQIEIADQAPGLYTVVGLDESGRRYMGKVMVVR